MAMDFENERYVKIYTRDTITLRMLSWQARAVLMQMLRKADRSGTIETGEHGTRGLAVVIDIPADVTCHAIEELVTSGTVVVTSNGFFLPRYAEGQRARDSAAQRKRNERERLTTAQVSRSAESVTEDTPVSQIVTGSESQSQSVTSGHSVTKNVTLRIEQNRTEQTRLEEIEREASPPDAAAPPKPKRVKRTKCQLPTGWEPDSGCEDLAAQLGVDCRAESVKFRDHFQANGKLHVDWQAAFRNWLRRAAEWGANRGGPSGGVSVAHAELARLTREAKARGEVVDDFDLFGGAS